MARQDDYENAFRIAAQELKAGDPVEIGLLSGAFYDQSASRFELEFIGRPHVVGWPDGAVGLRDGSEDIPLPERVLILHYLNRSRGVPLRGEWITYREVPSGEFYYSAFFKRAEAPLLKTFGAAPGRLAELAPEIGGRRVEGQGDAAAVFPALPMVPVTLVVWGGDDEFEPSGNVLFDRSVSHYLSTEDVAWLSGMIVYRLAGLAHRT